MNIRRLELSDFRQQTDDKKRQTFIESLGQSFEETGFAVIGSHDLSTEDQTILYQEIAAFFALPLSQKQQYVRDDLQGQRGYNGFKSETAKGESIADLKEFWHHGQAGKNSQEGIAGQYPNLVVSEAPNFTAILEKTYRALEKSSVDILRAIALYLQLPENYFDAKMEGGLSILRPLHYPPITQEPESAVRAAAHEDINLITLLMGASAGGLELLTRTGEWLPVSAPESYLVINVGDMLQRLTNKKLVSTTHRVVNPTKEQWHTSRYSVPFFAHPRPETSLACLDSCISDDKPKQFEDYTAQQYLTERLNEIRSTKKA
jgi:isopenicillin N synthase-like dioxygenase